MKGQAVTHIFDIKNAIRDDRRILLIFDDPRELNPADAPYGESGWHARVKIVIRHDKHDKCFKASIRQSTVMRRESLGIAYSLESAHDRHVHCFMKKPVARYTDTQLETFAIAALDFCAAALEGSICVDDRPLFKELLGLASLFTTEKELLAR